MCASLRGRHFFRRFLARCARTAILRRFRTGGLHCPRHRNMFLCAVVMCPWNRWLSPRRSPDGATWTRAWLAREDTRVRHHSSRSGTGKGDRLCRSEPINPSGSSASASLASWPAWPTAAAAPCWPGDGARDAMRSPSRKRTSSRRIARSFAVARRPAWHARWRAPDGGLAVTARTAWNDDFGCGAAATCARHARAGGPLPTVHWSFATCPTSPIHPATATASSPVARVAAPCSATG